MTGAGDTGTKVDRQRNLGLFGSGGHAVSLASSARAAGWHVAFLVDPQRAGAEVAGCPVVADVPTNFLSDGGQLLVAIGDNRARESVARDLVKRFGLGALGRIIDPTAACAESAVIGPGAFVGRGAVVGASAHVGAFCIVNSGAVLDHESVLEDFSSLAPGVTVGGRVKIGALTAIGIGATVRHSVRIGEQTVIGAHSYVHADVADRVVAWGAPVIVQDGRNPGDRYL